MARRRSASLWLCSPPKWAGLLASPPHLRFLLFSDEDPSSLTLRWNASAAELDLLQRSACRSDLSPAAIRRWSKRASQESKFQRGVVVYAIVRRVGLPCTLMTVTLSVCHAWGNRFLFRERLFSESDVGSMSACLAFTAERAFAGPLHGGVIGLCDWPCPIATFLFMQRQTQNRWGAHPYHDKGCQWARARVVFAWGAISQQAGWVVSPRVPSSPLPMLVPLLPRSPRRAH